MLSPFATRANARRVALVGWAGVIIAPPHPEVCVSILSRESTHGRYISEMPQIGRVHMHLRFEPNRSAVDRSGLERPRRTLETSHLRLAQRPTEEAGGAGGAGDSSIAASV